MNKRNLVLAWVILILTITASGCALVGTAISAGISYAIYQATKK